MVIAGFALQSQPNSPFIIKLTEPKKDPTAGLADVLIGSLGLTGAMVLLAVIAAGIFAGLLFWSRSSKPFDH